MLGRVKRMMLTERIDGALFAAKTPPAGAVRTLRAGLGTLSTNEDLSPLTTRSCGLLMRRTLVRCVRSVTLEMCPADGLGGSVWLGWHADDAKQPIQSERIGAS